MSVSRSVQKHILYLLVIFLFGAADGAKADSNSDNNANNGLDVSVSLRHQVVIPQIIYFRVGSATPGQIDKVAIDIGQSPGFTQGNSQTFTGSSIPLGNSNPIAATNNGTLAVDLRANVGTVSITYDLSNISGLTDGAGNFIPWEEIATQSDNAGFTAPILSNTGSSTGTGVSASVSGNLYSGRVVNRQANWTYRYENTALPVAGIYTGRISYTASAP